MGLLSNILSSREKKICTETDVVSENDADLSKYVTESNMSSLEQMEKIDSRVVYLEDGGSSNNSREADVFKGIREGDWKTMKRTLLYNDSLDQGWSQIVFTQSQAVMAALIASCDIDNFKSVISSMLKETVQFLQNIFQF